MACRTRFPDMDALACTSFEDMLLAVTDGVAGYAMVPVENSVAGRVADIHHLLPESGLKIIGEYFQPVRHQLLGVKGATVDDLKLVRSHAQGLAQCRKTLRKLKVTAHAHADTAGAACEVAHACDKTIGAIASSLAAEIYGLEILMADIEDSTSNTTRMLIMARETETPLDNGERVITTLIFRLRSVPAALYKALGGFASNGINLTKLESYMLDGQFEAVQFYIDAETHVNSESFHHALEELKFFCLPDAVQILGCYAAASTRRADKR